MASTIQDVAIAVVRSAEHVLVGIRAEDIVLPGMAEFPGGKCGPDETPAEAAARECLEETGIAVRAQELISEITHEYDHGRLRLWFFICDLVAHPRTAHLPEPREPFKWCPLTALSTLSFPPANTDVVNWLSGSK